MGRTLMRLYGDCETISGDFFSADKTYLIVADEF
jgi:hypothetical protein